MSLSSCYRDIGIPINFKKSQAASPFEGFNSPGLSSCQSDVRPPVEMRWRLWAFSSICKGYSGIPKSCNMKDKPAFKPLQGNTSFFLFRASWCPFHLRQQIQGPSHIPIAEGSFLLRCLWKVVIPFKSKPENQLSTRDNLGYTDISSRFSAELGVPLDLVRGSRGISGVA